MNLHDNDKQIGSDIFEMEKNLEFIQQELKGDYLGLDSKAKILKLYKYKIFLEKYSVERTNTLLEQYSQSNFKKEYFERLSKVAVCCNKTLRDKFLSPQDQCLYSAGGYGLDVFNECLKVDFIQPITALEDNIKAVITENWNASCDLENRYCNDLAKKKVDFIEENRWICEFNPYELLSELFAAIINSCEICCKDKMALIGFNPHIINVDASIANQEIYTDDSQTHVSPVVEKTIESVCSTAGLKKITNNQYPEESVMLKANDIFNPSDIVNIRDLCNDYIFETAEFPVYYNTFNRQRYKPNQSLSLKIKHNAKTKFYTLIFILQSIYVKDSQWEKGLIADFNIKFTSYYKSKCKSLYKKVYNALNEELKHEEIKNILKEDIEKCIKDTIESF